MEAEPESIHDTLKLLGEADWSKLRERSTRRSFQRNQTLVEGGQLLPALYLLRRGVVRVQQSRLGIPIVLARMGAGEVIGEMSLLENTVASASVIAEDLVEVDEIPFVHLHALLAADAGFASRFYQSIAMALSRRLRENSRLLAEVGQNMSEAVQLDRSIGARMGQISEVQIPEQLEVELASIISELHGIEKELKNRRINEQKARERVRAACDRIVLALNRHTSAEALIEIGYADLLAFRDTSQLEIGIGQVVFRGTFPMLMSSVTISRLYSKPRGFPDDVETAELLQRNEPDGDGWLGPMIDEWWLGRPIAKSRRSTRALMKRIITDLAARRGDQSTRILSLASGAARELVDLFGAGKLGAKIEITCVDLDERALVYAANLARGQPWATQFGFITGNVMRFDEVGERVALEPQHLIYALSLTDYLTDEEAIALFDWVHDRVAPGGMFVFSNLLDANPDQSFMKHLLDWEMKHRSKQEIEALCAASKFGKPRQIEIDETGINAIVMLER